MWKLRDHWAFLLVIAIQLLTLVAIPGRGVLARMMGTEITLRTRPIDPYNILSGYYVTLTYEVEQRPSPKLDLEYGDEVWVTVERDAPAWKLVSVTSDKPLATPDRVSIRAKWQYNRPVLEGAGRLYIPEEQRQNVDKLMGESRGKGLVDMYVDAGGTTSVIQLRIRGATFGE